MTKHIWVSGSNGFVGSHVLRHLLVNTEWNLTLPVSFRYSGNNDRINNAIEGIPGALDRLNIVRCDLTEPFSKTTEFNFLFDGREPDEIWNIASCSDVDLSIAQPDVVIKDNVALMVNVLEYARKLSGLQLLLQMSTDETLGPAPVGYAHKEWEAIKPSNPYSASKAAQEAISFSYWRTYGVPLVVTNCWDMATQVLTEHGLQGYNEISEGDLVWTLDENERMVLVPVQRTIRMAGPDNMVHFTGHTEQLVTPNHRMMFRESTGSLRQWGEITEATAEELSAKLPSGRVQFVRNGFWEGNTNPTYSTDDLIGTTPGRGGNLLPELLTASWLSRFFGWFVTEGTTGGNTAVRLAGMKIGQQQVFRDLLAEVNMDRVGSDLKSVYVCSKQLHSLARLCGGTQDVRRVPAFIKAMDTEYLQEFLDAAIAGDGTRYGQSSRIYTMNQDLAYDYAEIGMKCGYSAQVSRRVTTTFDGTDETETFYTNLSPRTGSNISYANIERVPYSGDVWCLSVSTGRVFTSRNDGGLVLTGQTMNVIGETQDKAKYVPKIIKNLITDQPVPVHISPEGVPGSRFYLHARNLADAWLTISSDFALSGVQQYADGFTEPDRFHIVGEREVTNSEMVLLIGDILGVEPKIKPICFHDSRPGHDLRYALDGSKIVDVLDWHAPISFEESLQRTVDWTLKNTEWLM